MNFGPDNRSEITKAVWLSRYGQTQGERPNVQRLSYPADTVFPTIRSIGMRIVLSCKDSPRKPLGQRPNIMEGGISCISGLGPLKSHSKIEANTEELLF